VCFLAFDEENNATRAIKVIPRSTVGPAGVHLMAEVAIMKNLTHKHIVGIHEYIDDPEADSVYLVMQYIPDGPIARMSDEGKCAPLTLNTVAHYAKQLASALDYMHRKGVMHGDIKPDNILVDSSTGGERNAYFADFGVSRTFLQGLIVDPSNMIAKTPMAASPRQFRGYSTLEDARVRPTAPSATRAPADGEAMILSRPRRIRVSVQEPPAFLASAPNESDSRQAPIDKADMECRRRRSSVAALPLANKGIGTPAFLSPEVFDGGEPTVAADMWAFGVTLFVMICGTLPFGGTSYFGVKQHVLENELAFPPAAPAAAKWHRLLTKLLQKDPAHRMTAAQLTQHSLLR
jgi:serine/threonine protein kinase